MNPGSAAHHAAVAAHCAASGERGQFRSVLPGTRSETTKRSRTFPLPDWIASLALANDG
jgi:hypothetical protein